MSDPGLILTTLWTQTETGDGNLSTISKNISTASDLLELVGPWKSLCSPMSEYLIQRGCGLLLKFYEGPDYVEQLQVN